MILFLPRSPQRPLQMHHDNHHQSSSSSPLPHQQDTSSQTHTTDTSRLTHQPKLPTPSAEILNLGDAGAGAGAGASASIINIAWS